MSILSIFKSGIFNKSKSITAPISLVKGRNGEAERDLNLSLYQTQSPYWQAIEVTEADLRLPPWLLTAKILFTYPYLNKLAHNDFALWHNSWDLSSLRGRLGDRGNLTPQDSSSSIAIIFLPQYLEFLGLAFLITPLFIFIFHRLSSKPKKASQ